MQTTVWEKEMDYDLFCQGIDNVFLRYFIKFLKGMWKNWYWKSIAKYFFENVFSILSRYIQSIVTKFDLGLIFKRMPNLKCKQSLDCYKLRQGSNLLCNVILIWLPHSYNYFICFILAHIVLVSKNFILNISTKVLL